MKGTWGVRAVVLGLAVMLLLPVTAVAAPTIIQDGAFTYAGGTWNVSVNSNYSGGSNHWTSTSGASAQVTFTGNSVAIIGTRANNRGIARIFLDGVDRGTINQYAATAVYQQTLWSASDFDPGTHTLRIVHTGTGTGPFVEVDAITAETITSSPASSPWAIAVLAITGILGLALVRKRILAAR